MIKTYSQAKTIVENKFTNSTYISARNLPENKKYFPEEIHYWATKIMNGNWSESLFNTEFDLVYSSIIKTNLSSIRYNDHIGQTFLVDSNSYPKGIFLSDIKLFFAETDGTPVTLDIRPLVNGYPSSSEIIPMSSVTTTPTIYSNIVQGNQSDFFIHDGEDATIFTFDFPVYLKPGYYCFTLRTNSSKNILYLAERGQPELKTGKIVTNPYIGSLVTSQQGISWTIEQTKDLCFLLRRAKFEVGTKNFDYSVTRNTNKEIVFDTLNLKLHTQEFDTTAFIDTINISSANFITENAVTKTITQNKTVELEEALVCKTNIPLTYNITMVNKDDSISPIIDTQLSGTVLVQQYINDYSTKLSDSELGIDGSALAKYVTKKITLNENFDADGLTVYLDSNKPSGTEIEVFYKIQNKYDFTKEFDKLSWTRMTRTTPSQIAKSNSEFFEETFQDLNLTYLNDTGTVYTDFKYFAIKIVMYSNNPAIVPRIKNLRAIATV